MTSCLLVSPSVLGAAVGIADLLLRSTDAAKGLPVTFAAQRHTQPAARSPTARCQVSDCQPSARSGWSIAISHTLRR